MGYRASVCPEQDVVLLTTRGLAIHIPYPYLFEGHRIFQQTINTWQMRKGETKGEKRLQHLVWTRITDKKYQELQSILRKSKDETLSGLVRKIIYKQPVKVYVHDETINVVMEELATLRTEIRAIGININQVTRFFNTYPEIKRKEFYARIAFGSYVSTESKIEELLDIISKLAKKWLSK